MQGRGKDNRPSCFLQIEIWNLLLFLHIQSIKSNALNSPEQTTHFSHKVNISKNKKRVQLCSSPYKYCENPGCIIGTVAQNSDSIMTLGGFSSAWTENLLIIKPAKNMRPVAEVAVAACWYSPTSCSQYCWNLVPILPRERTQLYFSFAQILKHLLCY